MPGFEVFGEEEKKEVLEVLDTGVLFRYGFDQARCGRWKARELERALAGRMGTQFAHLCSSGTAALSTAMAACGIGAGDEVIVPPFTFVADVEIILLAGAIPIFADIDETLGLNPAAAEAAITSNTRAVLAVHMCGAMAQIDALRDLCERRGLILIEDACQSVGGSFQGRPLGTFGRVGCFSFDAVKTVTCGEGGALITSDSELYARADAYADHGHDHGGNDRGAEGHAFFGTNYRISELNAAVGLAQFRKLDDILARQRHNKQVLKSAIEGLPGVEFRVLPDADGDTAGFLSFFLPTEARAKQVMKLLSEAGLGGCFYWYDNNWHYIKQWDHFKEMKGASVLPLSRYGTFPDYRRIDLSRSDAILSRNISMLILLSWTEDGLADRAKKLRAILKA